MFVHTGAYVMCIDIQIYMLTHSSIIMHYIKSNRAHMHTLHSETTMHHTSTQNMSPCGLFSTYSLRLCKEAWEMCVLPSVFLTPSACSVIFVSSVFFLVCSSSAEASGSVASIQASWLPTLFPSYPEEHAHDCHTGMRLGCGLVFFELHLCFRALVFLSCILLC